MEVKHLLVIPVNRAPQLILRMNQNASALTTIYNCPVVIINLRLVLRAK